MVGLPHGRDAAYTGKKRPPSGDPAVAGEPHHVSAFKPDAGDDHRGAADDHLENHLLTEENRRLKDELRRAESALKVAAKVLSPYLK
jgi:hypothetical protein